MLIIFRNQKPGILKILIEVKSIEIIHCQLRQEIMLYSWFKKKAATCVTAPYSFRAFSGSDASRAYPNY